jgi:hypothetical protein
MSANIYGDEFFSRSSFQFHGLSPLSDTSSPIKEPKQTPGPHSQSIRRSLDEESDISLDAALLDSVPGVPLSSLTPATLPPGLPVDQAPIFGRIKSEIQLVLTGGKDGSTIDRISQEIWEEFGHWASENLPGWEGLRHAIRLIIPILLPHSYAE